MTARSRRPDQDGPVARPASGTLGLLAAFADREMGEKLKAAIRRCRQQRQLRCADLLERKITAGEDLRDFKRFTGDEPGPPLSDF
jgi:hypothetical protein